MLKIIFKGENIADLKLQIQEYSLVHLGLNLKSLAENLAPKPPAEPLKNGQGVPGVTESVRLNDGTTRVHTPGYPGKPTPIPEVVKRRVGRPTGWRKVRPEIPTAEVAPATEPAPEPQPEVPQGPIMSKDRAKKAIHDLHSVKGFPAAKAALQKFGASHLNDVAIADHDDLIAYCEELANEPEPDGAA